MIPSVELMYNYDYAKRLYRGDGNFEDVWRWIIGLGADFEKIFNEYIEHVLKAIEKYSGFSWGEYAEENFPVYLAATDSSFPHPLTLVVSEDPEAMLYDLVYQLAHRNMFCGFKTEELRHECLRSITNHILKDLKLKELDKENLDLHNKTIKDHLKK